MSVKDFVPAGVLYQINATNSGTFNNATGIWVIGNRAVNQTVTLLISVKDFIKELTLIGLKSGLATNKMLILNQQIRH